MSAGSNLQRQRFIAMDESRRKELLDLAQKEFVNHGFDKASLNAILKNASMSKGQAYYYISGKADLYRAVCERAFRQLVAVVNYKPIACNSPDEFWRELQGLFVRLIGVLNADRSLAQLGRGVYASAHAEAALKEPLNLLQLYLQSVVQTGQKSGAIRLDIPLDLITSTMFGAMKGMDKWFAENMAGIAQNEAERLNAISMDMLRAFVSPKQQIVIGG